jgi:hypothetical protein
MELEQIVAIANSFKIRASATLEICAGEIGLTEKQQLEFDTLLARSKAMTDIMAAKLIAYHYKIANPELPEGAKTHCKKWLKEKQYRRRGDIKSKYIDKGNTSEEDGFTLMAVQLGLGMVHKNTQLHQNDYIIGTDDIFAGGIVYDNKCSYTLDSFPMYEFEIPDQKYEWQINSYADLRGCENGVLAYTLIDAPIEIVEREVKWIMKPNDIYRKLCELVYTKDYFDTLVQRFCPDATYTYFVEIPEADRIKAFNIKFDIGKRDKTYQRVIMCREYIINLLKLKYNVK